MFFEVIVVQLVPSVLTSLNMTANAQEASRIDNRLDQVAVASCCGESELLSVIVLILGVIDVEVPVKAVQINLNFIGSKDWTNIQRRTL